LAELIIPGAPVDSICGAGSFLAVDLRAMNIRYVSLGLVAAIALFIGNGCGQSSSKSSAPPLPRTKHTIVRVHWIGKRQLGIEANAYYLMRLWGLQASKDLETQTLNKLSPAPVLLAVQPTTANPQTTAILIRPLLNDLLQEESYFAVRQPTNKPAEFVLAIRLPAARNGIWQTNLAILAESLAGTPARPLSGERPGWRIQSPATAENLIEMFREGNWTFLGIARDNNSLLQETVARARSYRDPFSFRTATNDWLEADIDLSRLSGMFFSTNSPIISLAVNGDGANVLTHADLTFPQAIQAPVQSWHIPTNLIREPLTSFTATRGIQSSLAASRPWAALCGFLGKSNPPPSQAYFWSQDNGQFLTYFAAPMPNAADRVHELTDRLVNIGNPWLDAHGYVSFARMPDGNGFTWGNLDIVKPFLMSKEIGGGSFFFGGLLAGSDSPTNPAIRASLLQNWPAKTNLVYHDWELTGRRVEPWLYISQITRTVLRHAQMPMTTAGAAWLGNVKARLGESTTDITQTGPNQLSVDRKSTLGLTAPELHLLIDWLESPQFPFGLYTLSAPMQQ
jgi:hypothetical protein